MPFAGGISSFKLSLDSRGLRRISPDFCFPSLPCNVYSASSRWVPQGLRPFRGHLSYQAPQTFAPSPFLFPFPLLSMSSSPSSFPSTSPSLSLPLFPLLPLPCSSSPHHSHSYYISLFSIPDGYCFPRSRYSTVCHVLPWVLLSLRRAASGHPIAVKGVRSGRCAPRAPV